MASDYYMALNNYYLTQLSEKLSSILEKEKEIVEFIKPTESIVSIKNNKEEGSKKIKIYKVYNSLDSEDKYFINKEPAISYAMKIIVRYTNKHYKLEENQIKKIVNEFSEKNIACDGAHCITEIEEIEVEE